VNDSVSSLDLKVPKLPAALAYRESLFKRVGTATGKSIFSSVLARQGSA